MACGEDPQGIHPPVARLWIEQHPERMLVGGRTCQMADPLRVRPGESGSCLERVFQGAQEDRGIPEVPFAITRVGAEGGRLEDERSERRGDGEDRGPAGMDLDLGLNGPSQGLGSSVHGHQLVTIERWWRVICPHDVDDLDSAPRADKGRIPRLAAVPDESVINPVRRVDGRGEDVAERLERMLRVTVGGALHLDVHHDVDVGRGTDGLDTHVRGMDLCHQPADESPAVGLERLGELGHARPGIRTATGGRASGFGRDQPSSRSFALPMALSPAPRSRGSSEPARMAAPGITERCVSRSTRP